MKDSPLLLVVLVVLTAAIAAVAVATDSDRQDASAVRASQRGAPGGAFAGVRSVQPEDPRLLFNRGSAAVAAGEPDQAIPWFLQAALSEDERLAARAHYNLGTIAAQRARELFGDEPATAPPQLRQEGLALLTQAIVHYRDALDLDFRQADARFNLELIRLWMERMDVIWHQRDRRDHRRQLGFLEMLQRIEDDQRELRAQSLALVEQPDSAERRETARELAALQQLLSEEMGTLAKKIVADMDASGSASPGGFDKVFEPPTGVEDTIEAITDLTDEAQREMFAAAAHLRKGPLEETSAYQTRAVELLDEIRLLRLPFPRLVDRALQSQRHLVDAVAPLAREGAVWRQADLEEIAWSEQFVARWSQQLPVKAEELLQDLRPAFENDAEGGPSETPETGPDKSLWEAIKTCAEKASEVAPQVCDLADRATADLKAGKPALALPKQQEAMALLEAMFAALPQRAKEACQQSDEQASATVSQQGEASKLPSPAGRSPESPGKLLSAQSGAGLTGPRPSEPAELSQVQHAEGLSSQYVEAMMRRVRERQQQWRAMEGQLLQGQAQTAPVEKDW